MITPNDFRKQSTNDNPFWLAVLPWLSKEPLVFPFCNRSRVLLLLLILIAMPQPFAYVKEGFGATINFDQGHSSRTKYWVGTLNCISCVGIYLPIDANRCFVAHINAFVRQPNGEESFSIAPNTDRSDFIQDQIFERLTKHAGNKWTARDVADYVNSTNAEPIIICPFLDGESTGEYVIRGLETFFKGTGLDLRKYILPDKEGFIVEHRTHAVKTLDVDYGQIGVPKSMDRFEAMDVVGATKDWVIEV